jgi:phosphoribosyl-dephospho-CoA transferase
VSSQSTCRSGNLRRHDLVFVHPMAWQLLLETRDDLAKDPLLAGWVDRGWPLIARRFAPDEDHGVPLGLPLPPSADRRRIGLLMDSAAIRSTVRPPLLGAALQVAPDAWKPALSTLDHVATRYGVEARVFGSLAWSLLTGLNYLRASSDLDFILSLPQPDELARLIADLAAIDRAAPMRLDAEIVRDDGAGVQWRELHSGARDVLAKTLHGPTLLKFDEFTGRSIQSCREP